MGAAEVQESFATLSEGGRPHNGQPEYWNDGDIVVHPDRMTRNTCLALLESEKKITDSCGFASSSGKTLSAGTVLMTSRA